jgi:PEP-CTERM motif
MVIASLSVSVATAVPIGPGYNWVEPGQAQTMGAGDFFSTQYTAARSENIILTAWGPVSDEFEIWINGVDRLSSTDVPDWTDLNMPNSIPDIDYQNWQQYLGQAYVSGLYSTASFSVNKGDVIKIQLTHTPAADDVYYSGTLIDVGYVALKATPEPATFGLAGLALLALGGINRRRAASKERP